MVKQRRIPLGSWRPRHPVIIRHILLSQGLLDSRPKHVSKTWKDKKINTMTHITNTVLAFNEYFR